MCRLIFPILIGLFCFGPTLTAVGQTRRIDSPEVLKQLMALPAPTPRSAANPTSAPTPRPANFFDRANAPADDASIEDLVAYWNFWSNDWNSPRLTDTVTQRLLDFCVTDRRWLPDFLLLLSRSDGAATRIKEAYDKAQDDEEVGDEWRRQVKEWLLLNSNYFFDELLARAQKTRDNERNENVHNEEAISALAKLNWPAAEPLLRSLVATGQPRTGALAVSLFYQHAIAEKSLSDEERYRRELQAIALNRNLPMRARHTAIVAVSMSEWSGRDEWYLGLFQDETLVTPHDPNSPSPSSSLAPLIPLYNSDPDKWIPFMARLLKSDNLTVRSTAVSCLMNFQEEPVRKEALLPLLPWLTNPSWLKDPSNYRPRLIQTLGNVDVPESVPGLISIVDNDQLDNNWERAHAAKSLARYKDPRAVPALKKILAKETDYLLRQLILEGMVASGGLSQAEQLQALEAYAAKVLTPAGRVDMTRKRAPDEEPLPLQLSIGVFLATDEDVPESLVSAVLARAESLSVENPPVAKSLIEIVHAWQGNQIDLDVIRRIANGAADAAMISKALERRSKFQENLRPEVQALAAVNGAAQGVSAALLEDTSLAEEILTANDQTAQTALLACSRLMQMPLPVSLVGKLLRSKDPLLALAAETYLLAEDSREARELLWLHHPNEGFITGWRQTLNYPTDIYGVLRKTEEKLRAELFQENGPIEILAVATNQEHQETVLRVYPNKAVVTEYEDSSRYRERTASQAEVSTFKDFLTTKEIADRGPTIEQCYHNCFSSQFLSLTKAKGRRVFSQGTLRVSAELDARFAELANGAGVKTHYKLEQDVKGLEVLYAETELMLNDVWRQGNELRVLVERPETEEDWDLKRGDGSDEDDDHAARRLAMRRSLAERYQARFTWRSFTNDRLGAVTSQPDHYLILDPRKFVTDAEDGDLIYTGGDNQFQMLSPDSIILARNFSGLWKHIAGTKPVRLSRDEDEYGYNDPIVTGDGKWVVASRSKANWGEPSYLVRYSLQTGREFRVTLDPADIFDAVAFVASHNKVLIRRARGNYVGSGYKNVGPERPEYSLLDASTGATRLVSGEFQPLHQKGNRSLQRTEKPDEFWVAIPDKDKNQTRIGRYNARDFSFKPVLEVPHLKFESMAMYVDEKQAKIYLVYKGQLLRLPLPAASK